MVLASILDLSCSFEEKIFLQLWDKNLESKPEVEVNNSGTCRPKPESETQK